MSETQSPPTDKNTPKVKGESVGIGRHRIIVAYIFATLLVALAAVASVWTFNHIKAASDSKALITDTIIRADNFLISLIDIENAQRGFVITGDESFLPPTYLVRNGITDQLKELRALSQSQSSLKHLDALALQLGARLMAYAEIIELRRRQDVSAATDIILSPRGRQTTELMRIEVRNYIQGQTQALALQAEKFDAAMQQMLLIVIFICLLALLLAVAFAYMAFRETQHQLKNLVHLETEHLLSVQQDLNIQLQVNNIQLHISEERLAVTLNSIDDAVIATDAKGLITLLNPLAEKLTGWTQAQASLRPVEEIFHLLNADTREPFPVPVQETLAHGTTLSLANHTIVIARDGSETHIADSCAPIVDHQGQVVGAVLVFRDVTERKRLDQILQDKNIELARTQAVAEKANRAKSEFLSSMSHELRTPLSAILGFAQLMDSGLPAPTPSQKRSVDQILKAGWYLLDLINEILDLALIESGKLSLSLEPMSLSEVMRECHTMIEPQSQKRSLRVTFPSLEDECHVYVIADRTRVKQVLINLLSNAIKYNTVGGMLTVDCIVQGPARIRVCVKDQGAGLSPAQLEQLFQPFNRLGRDENAEEGTGIGLVMSKKLVELMGGAIGVESVVGEGSVFWFELNVTEKPQAAAASAPTSVVHAAGSTAAPLRTLLYVEDNPANLMLVEDLIARRPDIKLSSARDGVSGVVAAKASLPDVILMDINLPGISGIQAMQILAEDPATASIPVVALSANAMPCDIEKGLEDGFFRYLTKPIKVNKFMDTLDEAFELAKAQSARAKQKMAEIC